MRKKFFKSLCLGLSFWPSLFAVICNLFSATYLKTSEFLLLEKHIGSHLKKMEETLVVFLQSTNREKI